MEPIKEIMTIYRRYKDRLQVCSCPEGVTDLVSCELHRGYTKTDIGHLLEWLDKNESVWNQ